MQIGLIGYGYWGKKVFRNLLTFFDESSVFVCDANQNALDKHINADRFYSELNTEFLDKIQALIICTPVKSHFEIAKTALKNGKHVLLEKPATETLSQLLELKNIAETNHLVLAIDHTFMYANEIIELVNTSQKEAFGNVNEYISTRTIFGKFNRDVNVISDLATHDFSILYMLKKVLPKTVQVNAITGKSGLEETAFIFMQYADGMKANITCSWALPTKERTIFINGSYQQLHFDGNQISLYQNENEVNAGISNQLNERKKAKELVSFSPAETLKTVIEDFIQSINLNKKPQSDIESAIFVLKILEACNNSVEKGGVPINLS
jgi:predicted dehydrogenase